MPDDVAVEARAGVGFVSLIRTAAVTRMIIQLGRNRRRAVGAGLSIAAPANSEWVRRLDVGRVKAREPVV